MKLVHTLRIFFALIALAILAGCSKQSESAKTETDAGTTRVVATTSMIGDAVRIIAGDIVDLHTLMGPGVDPHLYKATKGDLDQLDGADIIFYNGLHLEAKMAEILGNMSGGKTTVAVAEIVPESLLIHHDGVVDPHVWFDVSLWTSVVERIGLVLAERLPGHADSVQTRTARLVDSLRALDGWVAEQMATIPQEQRVLITAHDAFSYFGKAYGTEVRGLQGISTVTEAGLYDVTETIDFIVERRIRAVFVESSVSQKAIQAVVDGCRERNHEITIGGELFSDAMGASGTPEETYLGMVRHNVNTIVSSLK